MGGQNEPEAMPELFPLDTASLDAMPLLWERAVSSPSQRSLAMLRKQGYAVTTVERYVSFVRQRFDAFGFGDLLCCKPGEPILLVQTTSAANMAARYRKIMGIRDAETWLRSGGAIKVHGWAKRGPRGSRKLWTATVRDISLTELLAQRDELLAPDTFELTA